MAKKKDTTSPKRPRKKPDRPPEIRSYSDADKADALLALEVSGGNVFLTAKLIGIPRCTLSEWARGKYINEDVLKLQQDKRPLLSQRLKDYAGLVCDILPSKLLTANVVQAATAMAIAIDKALLLDGKSSPKTLTDDECLNLIAAIVERAKSRRPEQDAPSGSHTPEPTPVPLPTTSSNSSP